MFTNFVSNKLLFLVAILFLLLGTDQLLALASNWYHPTAEPPNDNAPAPINVSDIDQVKSGGLSVGSLVVDGSGYVNGEVGIGTATTSGDLLLDVEGSVGATEYCDENGENCIALTNDGVRRVGSVDLIWDASSGCGQAAYDSEEKSYFSWLKPDSAFAGGAGCNRGVANLVSGKKFSDYDAIALYGKISCCLNGIFAVVPMSLFMTGLPIMETGFEDSGDNWAYVQINYESDTKFKPRQVNGQVLAVYGIKY